MSKRRTERLLSIVVLLLSSRRYLTAEQIRAAVIGYPEEQESFKRMFERDKEELRDLGIPLETGRSATADEEIGYRISRQDYELPEIQLEPDEAAVLGIASRVWQSAALEGAAAGAALKLRAASREGDAEGETAPAPGIQPRLTTQEPAFGALWEAVRDRRPVAFDHVAGGRSEVTRRTLEPWGVVNRRGRWYVAGHDRARDAPRVFRMSRIVGPVKLVGPPGSVTVPEGTDVREMVKDWDKPQTQASTARCCGSARTRASRCTAGAARSSPTPRIPAGTSSRSPTPTRTGTPATSPGSARTSSSSTRPSCARPSSGGSRGCWREPGEQPRAWSPRASGCAACSPWSPTWPARRVVGLAETAATFGMTERELIDDLNLAWCVELKAPEPYCPIDLSYEDGEISISQAESIARPLRLAADEASALLVALRMLAEAGGGDAVQRLIAKIEDAAGAAGAASSQVSVLQVDSPNARGMAVTLNAALAAGRRVHLRHYVQKQGRGDRA